MTTEVKQKVKHYLCLIVEGVDWRPLLIAPAALLLGVLLYASWPDLAMALHKVFREDTALILMGATFAVYGFRAKTGENPLMKVMCAFSFAFLCREIHFAGTSEGVYIAVAGTAVWAWLWRKRLAEPFKRGRFKTWSLPWAGPISLPLVQRRAFKYLIPVPALHELEGEFHIEIEEMMEVVAHAPLPATAFCGLPARQRKE